MIVERADLEAIPAFEPREWREAIAAALRAGARVLTLYGVGVGDEHVGVTCVLAEAGGALRFARTTASRAQGYHALTPDWPALHCFERELHEQTGLRVAGHPWLKPIRFSGGFAMDEYPFYKIEGKEVHEVAVGPIHAGVIEPGAFRFMCHGEQVHHLEIHLGYQHRGVEQRLLERDPRLLAPLVETIAGDTSVAHAWAYSAAIESLAGCALELSVEAARAVALELERVAMHLAGLAGLAADVGFLQGATTYGRLRTTAINTSMRLCGSRFGRGAVRPGGVGMLLPPELLADVRANIALLARDLALVNDLFLTAHTVQHRLRHVGELTEAQARELGIVGMVARASGVRLDARQSAAGGAVPERPVRVWDALPIRAEICADGDCWARAGIRIAEMDASLVWLSAALERFPRWEVARARIGALRPAQLAVAVVEGWRGEVVHCLETDSVGRLAHYKVQDPSLRNWMGLALAVRGNEISDFPICNKSFDLSYCGNDL